MDPVCTLCCIYNSEYCVCLWTRALLMCLGGGIPSPANIRLLYPGRRYIRIYPSSSNRDAYAAKSSLSFSSSLCNCECETHETRLQRGQERSSLQSFCFCCRITKLGILMTEGKSRQVGTELSSPVIYSVSHLGRKRGRHCFQLQGSMMHFCSPQLTAPPGPPLQNKQTNSLKKKNPKPHNPDQEPAPFSHGSARHIRLPSGPFRPMTFPVWLCMASTLGKNSTFTSLTSCLRRLDPLQLYPYLLPRTPALFPCGWRHVRSRGE